MKAVKGQQIAINTRRKDVPGAVRLTKETNMPQLVAGNHIAVLVDSAMHEETIWKAITNLTVHEAESVVFQGEDWIGQLRLEKLK